MGPESERDEAVSALADVARGQASIAHRVGISVRRDVTAGLVMGVLVGVLAYSNAVIFVVAPLVYFAVGALALFGSLERTGIRPHAVLIVHRGYVLAALIVLSWALLIAGVSQGHPGRWWLPVIGGVAVLIAVPALGRWRNAILRRAILDDPGAPGEPTGSPS